MKNHSQFKKGFGILEVLVSAVIIITILMALVFIGQTAMANSVYTQQRAQATFLAQEGIEKVRQIRDTNWIDRDPTTQWDTLKWNAATLKKVPLDTPPANYMFTGQNLVALTGTGESIAINNTTYGRTINVSAVAPLLPNNGVGGANDVNANINALKIKVTVTFNSSVGNGKTISASEVITNWRPNY